MTIKLSQDGDINFIQTATTTLGNSSADLRITTNTTSGSTFIAITTTGNIGIGTTSPRTSFEIKPQTGSTSGLMLYSGSDDAGINRLIFNHSHHPTAYLKTQIQTRALGIGQSARSDFAICVNTANDSNSATFADNKLFISGSNGNVGIGTTSPTIKLDISSAGHSFRIKNIGSGASSTYMGFMNSSETSKFFIGLDGVGYGAIETNAGLIATWTDNPIIFATNTTERMRITTNGSVGIGTTTPSTGFGGTVANVKLALRGGAVGGGDGQAAILIGADNNHYSAIWGGHTGGGNTYLIFGTSTGAVNPTEKMRIASNGNVGIGTSSPEDKLHVYNGDIRIHTSGAYGSNFMQIYSKAEPYYSVKFYADTASGIFRVETKTWYENYQYLTFQNGSLGVGTTSPQKRLDVQGDIGRVRTAVSMHDPSLVDTLRIGRWDGSANDDHFSGIGCSVISGNYSLVRFYAFGNAISMSREVAHIDYYGRMYNSSGTYGTLSDINLKENIETSRNYLNDILQLRVVKYSLKSENQSHADKLGFIAQEIETVFPNLVDTHKYTIKNEDGQDEEQDVKMIKTSVLLPMSIKCIQELNQKFEELNQRFYQLNHEFEAYKQAHP